MKDKFLGYFELTTAVFCFGFTGYIINELIRDFHFFLLMVIFIFGYGLLGLKAGMENLK